jgi:hypothetical protein
MGAGQSGPLGARLARRPGPAGCVRLGPASRRLPGLPPGHDPPTSRPDTSWPLKRCDMIVRAVVRARWRSGFLSVTPRACREVPSSLPVRGVLTGRTGRPSTRRAAACCPDDRCAEDPGVRIGPASSIMCLRRTNARRHERPGRVRTAAPAVALEHPVRRARGRSGRPSGETAPPIRRDSVVIGRQHRSRAAVEGDRHISNDRTPAPRCAMGMAPGRDLRDGRSATRRRRARPAAHRSPA